MAMECVDSRVYYNTRALNISRGNPSLTDSVRLEWLLNCVSLKPCKL